jgi:transposase
MPYIVDMVNLFEVPAYKKPDVLRQKYLEEGLTVKQISVLLGCGPTTIKKQLRHFNIKKSEIQEVRHKANLKYGQKLITGQIHEHKQETHIMQAILDMYQNQALSVTAIARLLTQMKVPTKKRGKGWDHSVVIDILAREGVYQPKRKGGKK